MVASATVPPPRPPSFRSGPISDSPPAGRTPLIPDAALAAAISLLSEAFAPDDGRDAACRRLAAGLARQLDPDGWLWVRSRVEPGHAPVNLDFLHGGCIGQPQLAAWAERSLEATDAIPCEHPPLRRMQEAGSPFAVNRRVIVPDEQWADDPTLEPMRAAGIDELLYAWHPITLPGGGESLLSGLCLLREPGRPPFTEADAAIVHLVFGEAGSLHTHGLGLQEEPQLQALTPRQRLVLAQLLCGSEPARIAEALRISAHSVAEHVKAICRRFAVQSRSELLQRLSAGSGG